MLGHSKDVRILRKQGVVEQLRGPARLREELRHQRLCTCGLTDAQCQVWGDVLEWVPRNDHLRLPDTLNYLLDKGQFLF